MQHPVIQPVAQAERGQRREEVHVAGRHLVVVAIARHRVEPAVVDRGVVGFVEFDVPDQVEGMAVEEGRPEGMRDRARDAARAAHFRKDVGLVQVEDIAVAGAAMGLRAHPRVDRSIARGGRRRQYRPVPPDARLAAGDPAFEIAEEPPPVAPGHPVENDQQQLAVHVRPLPRHIVTHDMALILTQDQGAPRFRVGNGPETASVSGAVSSPRFPSCVSPEPLPASPASSRARSSARGRCNRRRAGSRPAISARNARRGPGT